MRGSLIIALGVILLQTTAPAQTKDADSAPVAATGPTDSATGVVGAPARKLPSEYSPLTSSERWKLYFASAFGPRAILRSAAVGGITQAEGTPKEWGGGAEAYGDRFGNAMAKRVIRKTLESGGAALLHQDNRYFRSMESGFWKRTKHAIGSWFIARNTVGEAQFAYARFGAAVGTPFIARIWKPRSVNTVGDAAVSFGWTAAFGMGWNVFKEFGPARFRRQ